MKRFFYILFISTTVFFSFGFRACDDFFCAFIGDLTHCAWGMGTRGDSYTIVGPNGKIYECTGDDRNCACGFSTLSTRNLNNIDRYEGSNSDANEPGDSATVIVGDTGTVFLSLDGGTSWDDRSIPGITTNLYSFDFLDYGLGDVQVVVCGESGTMYKSTNSGSGWDWQQVNTITTRNLTSMIAMTTDLFIAVGDSGTIIKTNNGGQTWENKSVQVNKHFNRIFNGMPVSAFGHAWAVGNNAYILATTDYGNSWFPQYPLTFDTSMIHIYDIAFRNQNDGILVGQGGLVNYTTNGGTTWLQDPYFNGFTNDDIISLAVRDENTASVLVRGTTSDGTATTTMITVSSEPLAVDDNNNIIPSEYSLEQNFPNPFNPSTVIRYQLPYARYVTLKVYDVLGNEVTTLVNENKPAGTYSEEFTINNAKLSSGVYYYQLRAGDPSTGSGQSFVESKKMILLK